ncbi:MAG: hypothetical protein ACTS4Z_01075 [Candidatus Hodgkinia cicadicola]
MTYKENVQRICLWCYNLRRKVIPIVANAERIQLTIGLRFEGNKRVELEKRKLVTSKVEEFRIFERALNKKRIKGELFNLW